MSRFYGSLCTSAQDCDFVIKANSIKVLDYVLPIHMKIPFISNASFLHTAVSFMI